MNGLIVTICLALSLSGAHCQLGYNSSATDATALNSSLMSQSTPTDSLTKANTSDLSLSLNGTTSLNDTSASNTTSYSNVTSGSSDVADTNSTTATASHTSFFSQVFTFNHKIDWSEGNFSVYHRNGTVAYVIAHPTEGANVTKKEFVVEDALVNQQKLRIDAHAGLCGFGRTYVADDGTSFTLDPRMFLADRWYIKQESTIYIYKRYALSLNGDIVDGKSDRTVAQVSINSTKSSVETNKSEKTITLSSDGSIPAWDLIAFLAVVRTRVHACGY